MISGYPVAHVQRKKGDTTAADHLYVVLPTGYGILNGLGLRRGCITTRAHSNLKLLDGVLATPKAIVSDDEAVSSTSANLTEAALERNIEPGLLVRDRALAESIVVHFRGLSIADYSVPCPGTDGIGIMAFVKLTYSDRIVRSYS